MFTLKVKSLTIYLNSLTFYLKSLTEKDPKDKKSIYKKAKF